MAVNDPLPPFPTDAKGAFADDQPTTASLSAEKEWDQRHAWERKHAEELGRQAATEWDSSGIGDSILSGIVSAWAWYCRGVLKWELSFDQEMFTLASQVMDKILPLARDEGAKILELMVLQYANVIQDTPTSNNSLGQGEIAKATVGVFEALANQFSLLKSGINPRDPGSGIKAQQLLVANVTGLVATNWWIDWASQHLGLGQLKDLQPVRQMADEIVNTRNVIRQANNAAYAMLLHAPLTRDLNRAYPIKNIGLNALARLYVRGAINQHDFFDKCLDSGLDSTQAQQLVLESAKMLGSGNIGDLVNHGFIGEDDALTYLKHSGFQEGDARALLYAETHSRYWSIQERVGNAAVTAWTKGRISKDRLESILQQCGFTDDEITLLKIEQEFAKHVASKELTYSQVRQLFEANIIGIDDVIDFLDHQGYNAADRNNLVLLDFTKLEERQSRLAKLAARDRVQADSERIQAAADEQKQQRDLANARKALASALDDEAKVLGNLLIGPALKLL